MSQHGNASISQQEDALNIRFNKFPFADATGPPEGILPLGQSDYPMTFDTASILQETTLAHSIMKEGDYECRNDNVYEWIETLGGWPNYPSSNSSNPYWQELREVVELQAIRLENEDTPASEIMPLPQLWSNYTLRNVTDAVHLPILGTHHLALLVEFNKAGLEIDETILPTRGARDFIGREIRLTDLASWAIGEVAAVNFWLKWTVGRPRPEEVAWLIATGNLTQADGVPGDIVEAINSMELASPENLTAFPEGCPPHPSWPAMHAAASGMSLWLPVVAKLSQEQYCQVLLLDYAVSFGRTVAGVHYPDDNIAGQNFAQEFISRALPRMLARRYGADRELVRNKIAQYRFDWNTFDASSCLQLAA
jgi:membrane-associated phospholipid phosphatase